MKPLDTATHFRERYWHSTHDIPADVNVINVHHATTPNPFINYPFLAVDKLSEFCHTNQAAGRKVKIYYTIRELTTHLPELWALRSLGDEVLADGPGGGYPWLREHLGSGYTTAWYNVAEGGVVDAAILTSGASRWYNFYVEGINWLARNVPIDGLYLDDVAYDRTILRRVRKVLDRARPGCLIDLHSNTYFSMGPANQYTEFFPYVDRLWFGEGFQYDAMSPEQWLVECSGIPFGLMGDMLEGGGNRWRGMLFGMTARLPWVECRPAPGLEGVGRVRHRRSADAGLVGNELSGSHWPRGRAGDRLCAAGQDPGRAGQLGAGEDRGAASGGLESARVGREQSPAGGAGNQRLPAGQAPGGWTSRSRWSPNAAG